MIDVTLIASIRSSNNINSKPFLKAEAGREKSKDKPVTLKHSDARVPSLASGTY